jgi:polyisoprenoid-binding protein YceI
MATQTWQLDTTHTSIGFTVRHMVVAKVHGHFKRFSGQLTVDGDSFATGSAEVELDTASIDTGVEMRDNHLRSEDFFAAERFPKLRFRSQRVEQVSKDQYRVVGELTIRDITRQVTLDTEFLGQVKDPFGNQRLAFNARTRIDRRDFGLTWNKGLEAGGVLVGESVDISLDVQAVQVAAEQKAA